MKPVLKWLEKRGVDCSRLSNQDDAIALVITLMSIASLLVATVSTWWSGFLTAVTIVGAGCWLKHRYRA